MDTQNIVEEITRQVISQLEGQNSVPSGGSVSYSRPSGAQGRAIFVFTGGNKNIEAIYSSVRSAASSDTVAVLSPGALNLIGKAKITSLTGIKNIVTSHLEINNIDSFFCNNAVVVVPVLTLNTLSKVINFECDTIASYIIIQALSRNIKVIALNDNIIDKGGVNSYFKQKVKTMSEEAVKMGMTLIPAARFNSSVMTGGRIESYYPSEICGGKDCRIPESIKAAIDAGASRIGAALGVAESASDIGSLIDHTLLKPEVTKNDIMKLLDEAKKYKFASVCINPHWVNLCAKELAGSGVMVCTVVGFPLGATSTAAKVAETKAAISDGADEIDMVINIGALKAGDFDTVREDIRQVVAAAQGRTVKVILETGLLTDKEKVNACKLCKEAGADFVKTSTGFGHGGATIADIALMRRTVGPDMGVKASGGVRDLETARDLIEAGATRLGASASVKIVQGGRTEGDY